MTLPQEPFQVADRAVFTADGGRRLVLWSIVLEATGERKLLVVDEAPRSPELILEIDNPAELVGALHLVLTTADKLAFAHGVARRVGLS